MVGSWPFKTTTKNTRNHNQQPIQLFMTYSNDIFNQIVWDFLENIPTPPPWHWWRIWLDFQEKHHKTSDSLPMSKWHLTSNKQILPFRFLLAQFSLLHQRHNDAIHGCQWWTWCIFITLTIHRFGDQGIVFIEKHCIREIRKPWKT